jgi:tRNA threonylcarbamoyl adenosine modification protein (Sua5/YciO/YrdC/YwlC family)
MAIKKVVIAAAGEGTRMLHLTTNKSKHLIKVKKRPFLAYLLDNLFLAGYRELILVVGYKEDLIKKFLSRYKPPLKSLRSSQYTIKMVSQYDILGPKSKIYGTACPLMVVEDIVKKSPFIYLCGDNLYSVDDLKLMQNGSKYCFVASINKKNPEKYGVLIEEKGFLKEIKEKPKEFAGNLVNTGLYKFTSEVFGKLGKIKKSPRGEYEITDVINLLARSKMVKVKIVKDFWMDFGNPADIIQLSVFLKSFKKFKKLFWKNRRFNIIPSRSPQALSKAVECLQRGQTVVCPTDTVYGLLADATNDKAVQRVFDIKKRDRKKAVPVFVRDLEMAKKYAIMDKDMEKFLQEIWPGKITVALNRKKNSGLSEAVAAGKKTVGLRIPDYKILNQILEKFGRPIIGTSANISGKPSTVKIEGIYKYFEDEQIRPDLILDGGNLVWRNPSSVIDFSHDKPKIIRRGR